MICSPVIGERPKRFTLIGKAMQKLFSFSTVSKTKPNDVSSTPTELMEADFEKMNFNSRESSPVKPTKPPRKVYSSSTEENSLSNKEGDSAVSPHICLPYPDESEGGNLTTSIAVCSLRQANDCAADAIKNGVIPSATLERKAVNLVAEDLCKSIIFYGPRKGKPCGLHTPCRYHRPRAAPKKYTEEVSLVSPLQGNADCALSFDLYYGTSVSPTKSEPSEEIAPSQIQALPEIQRSARKNKVTVRLVGKESQQQIRSSLHECLRDRAVRKRTLPLLQEKYGDSCYYLRHTEARAVALISQQEDSLSAEVDHTFECQLIAHAVVQCPDYAQILRQYDLTTRNDLITQQGFVVQSALRPIYSVQNNIHEPDLFNLRLLHPSINRTKRFAYTNFLKRVYDVRRGDYNISDDMERLLEKHTSSEDAVLLCRSLLTELRNVEDPYVSCLQSGWDGENGVESGLISERSRQEIRLNSLAESVKLVFEDLQD